ncbi:MAG TPA: hypothetical protein VK983_01615 [Candidatus Limnocylindrales bacterium]|nr:hypothetical protein [Candidatus Limnocylindrales bacterium]
MQPQLDLAHLTYNQPVMATDGNIVTINEHGVPTLLFLQFRGQHGPNVAADVVAGVRLHSIEELKDLHRAITETIEKHETKEP